MTNTTVKNSVGDNMNDNMVIRLDKELKEKFRKAAAKVNPHIPQNQVVSIVIRELMIKYIDDFERKDKR